MQTKIIHITWNEPDICLHKRVAQICIKCHNIIKGNYIYWFKLHGNCNKKGVGVSISHKTFSPVHIPFISLFTLKKVRFRISEYWKPGVAGAVS